MRITKTFARLTASLCALAGASLIAAGCGSDDSDDSTTACRR